MPTHLQRHDEAGHIHFWTISTFHRLQFFHDDGAKHIAIDGLRHLQTKRRICRIGYVIMPDHEHILLLPHARGSDTPLPISELLHDFKQYVGFHGKARLRDVWREQGTLWSPPLNDWAHGKLGKQSFWNTRGYDRNIFTESVLHEKLNYCHKNPVTRGLVATAINGNGAAFVSMTRMTVRSSRWIGTADGRWCGEGSVRARIIAPPSINGWATPGIRGCGRPL